MNATATTPKLLPYGPVPAGSLDAALDHVRAGGRLAVSTMTRVTVVDLKCLRRFEAGGHWLLRESGDGYRIRRGKNSDYLFPGQLQAVD